MYRGKAKNGAVDFKIYPAKTVSFDGPDYFKISNYISFFCFRI